MASTGEQEKSATTAFSMEDVPSSLWSIAPILRIATEVQSSRPRVSYLCRLYALKMANQLDATSCGLGVQQFKAGLFQILEHDNASSLLSLEGKTDVEVMDIFHKQCLLSLDEGEQAYRDELTKASDEVFKVLRAVMNTEQVSPEIMATTNDVHAKEEICAPSIPPLDADNKSDRILRYLPQHFINTILEALPKRTCFNFRNVSSEWNETITSLVKEPVFLLNFVESNECTTKIVKYGSLEEYAKFTVKEGGDKKLEVCASGSGIIVFTSGESEILWNPLCLKSFVLREESPVGEFSFIFGVVSTRIDCKVLRVHYGGRLEAYSLSTRNWEVHPQEAPFSYTCGCQVDLDEKSYWIGVEGDNGVYVFASYDANEGVFHSVPVNESYYSNNFTNMLMDYGSQLLFRFENSIILLHGEEVAGGMSCNIWRMTDDDGEAWELLRTFSFEELVIPLGYKGHQTFLWAGVTSQQLFLTNFETDMVNMVGTYSGRLWACPHFVPSLD